MRVALVHDWLLTYRGGEKVLLALANMFPQAPIYTLLFEPNQLPLALVKREIHASLLNRIASVRKNHRYALPLFPAAIRSLTLPQVDLVLSSSHCVAKGVVVPKGAKHLSYVHAPMRYMYDRFDDYFGAQKTAWPTRIAARAIQKPLQWWDKRSTDSVDTLVANSEHVRQQIFERYRRSASVVHPPVELERFTAEALPESAGQAFLFFGAAAPYKRVDLAIEAFARLKLPLVIAGVGHRQGATLPDNVTLLESVTDAQVPALYRSARALIFPGIEDFGLTPLESMACGRPVIAFAGGGALETVRRDTGILFAEQSVESLVQAVHQFERDEHLFQPALLRQHAGTFSLASFERKIREAITETVRS
jgi:glycosyltransferase involved in cell wall biosynthesis